VRDTTVMHWGFRPAIELPLAVEDVPKTSLGKIQRTVLRQRLERGDFAEQQTKVAELGAQRQHVYVAPIGPMESAVAEIYASMFGT
jgi:hypothetical protein